MPDALASAHILTYGTLLGTTIFHSFISGTTAYRILPRPAFSTLQTALSPIYFSMQTALPVMLALTYPGTTLPGMGGLGTPSSVAGVLDPGRRWDTLVPMGLMLVCGAANLLVVGPQTRAVKKERKRQETRDGKKAYDKGAHSAEMERLNRSFARIHGVSSFLNLVGILAAVGYGLTLADRIQ